MKITKFIVFSLVLGIIFLTASMIRYEYEVGGDFEVFSYGSPFLWLFHDLQSFAGPVDIWSIQWPALIMDFVLWFVISVTIVYLINKYKANRK